MPLLYISNYLTTYKLKMRISYILAFFASVTMLACSSDDTQSNNGTGTSQSILPVDFTATAGDQRVTLGWTSYSDSTIHNIYRSSNSGCYLDNYSTACSDGVLFTNVAPGLADVGLTNGTTYYYWIEATLDNITLRADTPVGSTPRESANINPLAGTTTAYLNDTGIDWGGNFGNTNNEDCTSDIEFPQDCTDGRDATDNRDSNGNAGFLFTKLDSLGNSLGDNATEWSCVLDNVTGLIWEVKTDDDGLHNKNDEYTWYNSDPNTNGGYVGYADDSFGYECYGYNSNDTKSFCNTEAFVNRVNTNSLCGARDWRLPSRGELQSIVDYSSYDPSIDTEYFPNTQSDDQSYDLGYWSSSPFVSDNSSAWMMNFINGYESEDHRRAEKYVRLVRSR